MTLEASLLVLCDSSWLGLGHETTAALPLSGCQNQQLPTGTFCIFHPLVFLSFSSLSVIQLFRHFHLRKQRTV